MPSKISQSKSDLTKRDFRAMILILFKLQKTRVEIYESLQEHYPDLAPSLSTVERWKTEYSHNGENVNEMLDLTTKDPHITYAQLEYKTELSSGTINIILHKELCVRKLCARWIPHSLNLQQKISRIDFCKIMLKRFANGSSRAVSEILTGDETWIYHYDTETKRMSKEWVEEDAPPLTKVQRARPVGKQMWAIFFRSSWFVEAVALEDRKTVTADWYTTVCLPKVITAIESQREKTGIRGILLHHGNASSHTAIRTREFLENSGLKTLPHPPYSPDLAPCDFWLFPRLKDQLRGRRFSTNEELRGALFQAIGDIPKEDWKKCV
ncbi:Histone-lysine N-methyltransferase SETMAR-like [Oopsacas minuta]|uniref:Histone-lysine N-methyltransferase SETMAR-like n=1 Tax=Oopsacas minuta TaxID=111878 RepID=A0AAV7KJF7_9METZ|nr:Histone-lysine N-methyltransferase SETMAR-like [Oopsacas minuta]